MVSLLEELRKPDNDSREKRWKTDAEPWANLLNMLEIYERGKKLYAFNGIWAYNLRVTVVMHYQLSYGAKQEAG